jgi:hypothetical protein
VSLGATLTTSLLAVLERPSTWLLALVGFLIRGGWLLVLAPIVVLPTAVGIANVVAPLLEDVAFGRRMEDVLTVSVTSLVVIVVWLVLGGILVAATEVETVRMTAGALDGRIERPAMARAAHPVRRVLAVRLVTLAPLGIALAWASIRFVSVGYLELTNPSDVATPAAYRILAGAPDAVIALVVTLLLAEILGGVAARRVILTGDGVRPALRGALRHLRRAALRLTGLATVSAAVMLTVLAVTALGTSTTWDALRAALANGDSSIGTSLTLLLFVALFAGSLVLVALTAAWRSAIWTVEVDRASEQTASGTFGGGDRTRSGD